VRHLLVDISPLRDSVAYRRLWFNDLLSAGASQVSVVALPYQVYALTGSSLLVGLIGLAALIPLLAGAVVAGAITDSFDRRRLLVASQLVAAMCSLGLALLAVASAIQALFYDGDFPLMPGFVLPGVAALVVGLLLVAWTVLRGRVVPAWAGTALLAGAALMVGVNEQTAAILLAVPFGVAWFATGVALLVPRRDRSAATHRASADVQH